MSLFPKKVECSFNSHGLFALPWYCRCPGTGEGVSGSWWSCSGKTSNSRETEESRAQERTERPFSLLERMLNKYIISHSLLAKRKRWEKMGTLLFFNVFFAFFVHFAFFVMHIHV